MAPERFKELSQVQVLHSWEGSSLNVGWITKTETNTLAYLAHSKVTKYIKCFNIALERLKELSQV
jgi:hypothetical protein